MYKKLSKDSILLVKRKAMFANAPLVVGMGLRV